MWGNRKGDNFDILLLFVFVFVFVFVCAGQE